MDGQAVEQTRSAGYDKEVYLGNMTATGHAFLHTISGELVG